MNELEFVTLPLETYNALLKCYLEHNTIKFKKQVDSTYIPNRTFPDNTYMRISDYPYGLTPVCEQELPTPPTRTIEGLF